MDNRYSYSDLIEVLDLEFQGFILQIIKKLRDHWIQKGATPDSVFRKFDAVNTGALTQ